MYLLFFEMYDRNVSKKRQLIATAETKKEAFNKASAILAEARQFPKTETDPCFRVTSISHGYNCTTKICETAFPLPEAKDLRLKSPFKFSILGWMDRCYNYETCTDMAVEIIPSSSFKEGFNYSMKKVLKDRLY